MMDGEDHVLLCNQIRLFKRYTLHNLDSNDHPEFGRAFVDYCKGFITKNKGSLNIVICIGWNVNKNDKFEVKFGNNL